MIIDTLFILALVYNRFMKLAFVSFYSGLANRGGETYVDALAERLSKKHEVYVFQAGKKEMGKKYVIKLIKLSFNPNHFHKNLSVTHTLKRLFLDYFHLKELSFTLKVLPKLWKLKPEIIFPQNSGWEVVILRIFSSIINSRIIVAGESGPGWNDRVNLYIHPDCFVALTNFQMEWAKKVTPWKNQKIVIIPNGVDTNKFTVKGSKYKTDLTYPTVIAVGAAIKSKRIPETIKAVAQLKNISLLIVGTGPNEEQEDLLGKKLLGTNYKRLKVSHKEMPSVYRSSDIFTLCSDSSEASAISYLEALASGLPCVATDDSSRREVLGSVGFYVKDPKDSIAYANRIKVALAQKSPDKYLKHVKKYSWDLISEKYEKILDEK